MIQKTVDLVKLFEGYSGTAYLCPANVWTIGYGTTRYPGGGKVTPLDTCTDSEAENWLISELAHSEAAVLRLTTVPLAEEQLGALTSFVYNLGAGAFRASTLRARVNSFDYHDVPTQFRRWVYAGGRKLTGLERRRAAEIDLWLEAWVDLWMSA